MLAVAAAVATATVAPDGAGAAGTCGWPPATAAVACPGWRPPVGLLGARLGLRPEPRAASPRLLLAHLLGPLGLEDPLHPLVLEALGLDLLQPHDLGLGGLLRVGVGVALLLELVLLVLELFAQLLEVRGATAYSSIAVVELFVAVATSSLATSCSVDASGPSKIVIVPVPAAM